jgi:flagellar hook assembly protein FlgD
LTIFLPFPVFSQQFQGIMNALAHPTEITFALPEAGQATLRIYALTGQRVRTLVESEMAAGRHSVSWNGRDEAGAPVASGVYFYQLVVQKQNGEAAFTQTKRMTLLK